MKIDIIEKFQIEGRGTVFTCHLPEIEGLDYAIADKKLTDLRGSIFFYGEEGFKIREIEMMRSGFFNRPRKNQIYGLLVRKVDVPVAQLDRASFS